MFPFRFYHSSKFNIRVSFKLIPVCSPHFSSYALFCSFQRRQIQRVIEWVGSLLSTRKIFVDQVNVRLTITFSSVWVTTLALFRAALTNCLYLNVRLKSIEDFGQLCVRYCTLFAANFSRSFFPFHLELGFFFSDTFVDVTSTQTYTKMKRINAKTGRLKVQTRTIDWQSLFLRNWI